MVNDVLASAQSIRSLPMDFRRPILLIAILAMMVAFDALAQEESGDTQ